jgi:hypothetical protein
VVWTPTVPDTYAVRVWVRRVGSSADFDAELSSGNFSIISELPTLLSVTADHVSPLFANVPVHMDGAGSGWHRPSRVPVLAGGFCDEHADHRQDYSPANTFTWTPGPTDGGSFHVQVRVRAIGSGVPYQALLDSETFDLLGLTNFTLNSQPGDFIGHGQHIARSDAGATMTLQTLSERPPTSHSRRPHHLSVSGISTLPQRGAGADPGYLQRCCTMASTPDCAGSACIR